MISDIISPLAPKNLEGWKSAGDVRGYLGSKYPIVAWFYVPRNLSVLSAVEVATDDLRVKPWLQYHISITKKPNDFTTERSSADEAKWVMEQFGLDGWEEDNHVPDGKARNFWRNVADNTVGKECACKADETVIAEGDYENRPLSQ